ACHQAGATWRRTTAGAGRIGARAPLSRYLFSETCQLTFEVRDTEPAQRVHGTLDLADCASCRNHSALRIPSASLACASVNSLSLRCVIASSPGAPEPANRIPSSSFFCSCKEGCMAV